MLVLFTTLINKVSREEQTLAPHLEELCKLLGIGSLKNISKKSEMTYHIAKLFGGLWQTHNSLQIVFVRVVTPALKLAKVSPSQLKYTSL